MHETAVETLAAGMVELGLLPGSPDEVVANYRFSADAFVVAGDLAAALEALADCGSDNAAARAPRCIPRRLPTRESRAWYARALRPDPAAA